jgi:hypothetical protein
LYQKPEKKVFHGYLMSNTGVNGVSATGSSIVNFQNLSSINNPHCIDLDLWNWTNIGLTNDGYVPLKGTGSDDRVGDSIAVVSQRLRFCWQINPADTSTDPMQCRIIVIRLKNGNPTDLRNQLTWDDFFQSRDMFAFRKTRVRGESGQQLTNNNVTRYKIVHDESFTLVPGIGSETRIRNIRLPSRICTWKASSASTNDFNSNAGGRYIMFAVTSAGTGAVRCDAVPAKISWTG